MQLNIKMLSEEQTIAYNYIINTFKTDPIVLLHGRPGVGKSHITKHISNYYIKQNIPVCGVTPTHKSKRILSAFLNDGKIMTIPTFTVASFLCKMKEHSYIGSQTYTKAQDKKFILYKLFILDEVSMVSDSYLLFIMNYIKKYNKLLLIIGDACQIPCITAKYNIYDNYIEKANSFIFTSDVKKVELNTIVRQLKDSPIIQLTSYVRDHIDVPFDITDTNYNNMLSCDEMYLKFIELFIEYPTSCKIIAYTNQSVKKHNIALRMYLDYHEPVVVNDIVTGYANIGWPELIIENGQDYIVTKIKPTTSHTIDKFDGLCGYLVDLNVINSKKMVYNLFFINAHDTDNYDFINELIRRGERVNARHSSKKDYINYNALKNKVLFLEDLYKYNDAIYSESDFKEAHSLLFTKVDDVIKDNQQIISKLSDKVNTTYVDIIEKRLMDNKIIGDSESLADQFKMIEKDIYYGYCITSHRAQGSTYDAVFVDENDYAIHDRFNYKYDKMERKIKEKNQLRYVAYSRSKTHLYIVD
jgi:hypothetical protein